MRQHERFPKQRPVRRANQAVGRGMRATYNANNGNMLDENGYQESL
jgi:hypothetical protein